jgi:hypothetical protein
LRREAVAVRPLTRLSFHVHKPPETML